MIRKAKISYADGFTEQNTESGHSIPGNGPVMIDDILMLSADDFGISCDVHGDHETGARSHFVSVFCAKNKLGFAFHLTPLGARSAAEGLLAAAAEADAHIASQASDAIEAARKTGGRA